MIVQQVDRCAEIIRNLLDFARKREPVVQAVDLNRVVEDMTRLVEKEARNNNIAIERRYDPELPLIYSDAPELRQVVLESPLQCRPGHRQRRHHHHHYPAGRRERRGNGH